MDGGGPHGDLPLADELLESDGCYGTVSVFFRVSQEATCISVCNSRVMYVQVATNGLGVFLKNKQLKLIGKHGDWLGEKLEGTE